MHSGCTGASRKQPALFRCNLTHLLCSVCSSNSSSVEGNSSGVLSAALKACGLSREVELGARLQGRLYETTSSIYVHNALLDMYAKCGRVSDAAAVFWRMPCHDHASWNGLILGYAAAADADGARRLLACMASSSCPPTAPTFLAALKACVAYAGCQPPTRIPPTLPVNGGRRHLVGDVVKLDALEWGMSLHAQARHFLDQVDLFLSSALIDMYAKCGSLVDCRVVFDRMPVHDVVSWTCLMLGYVDCGQGDIALELFACMTTNGHCQPNSRTFVAALVACAALADKEEGRLFDGNIVKQAFLERGRALHAGAVEVGADSDSFVSNTLIDMYSRCGSLVDARNVFDRMVHPDVVSWNVMISGYADNGQGDAALDLFARITCPPTSRTFVAALMACCSIAALSSQLEGLEKGKTIHARARATGCEFDVYVASTLVFMYAKCGCLREACFVFERMPRHDVVSSTALMLGYTENNEPELALQLYQRMQGHGTETIVAALKACAAMADKEEWQQEAGSSRLVKSQCLEAGTRIHGQATEAGCGADIFVANTLIDMYCKCGSLEDGRAVFDSIHHGRSLVSWNALLLGYVENGEDEVALDILHAMRLTCAPDARSYVAGLMACGNLVALDAGRRIHSDICREEVERNNPFVLHRLVDFYSKCGSLTVAQLVFDESSSETCRDVLIWSALIAGYSCRGDTKQVFQLFHNMKRESVQPNAITFISLLNACNHGGLVDDGEHYFTAMSSSYGIQPEIRHYHCMVDMLGRANRLDDALALVKSMPFQPTLVTWTVLLGACRKWSNLFLGKLAFEAALKLDDSDAATYTLMANIYGSLGMWQQQSEVLITMRQKTAEAV